MSILAAFAVPHPPIAIAEIGKGEEHKIQKTIDSYKKVAQKISELKPETIVIISPHATAYSDYFHISPGKMATGDMSNFNAPDVFIGADYDTEFVKELCQDAINEAFPAGMFGESNPSLDHGTIIPLYFISKEYSDFSIVRVGLSGLSAYEHYRLGTLIQNVSNKLNKPTVVIGSGDLSHKLKEDGPYGFSEDGPIYDGLIMDILKTATFSRLFDFDEDLCTKAAECGHRSFCMMAGTLDNLSVIPEQLSYEDTFGVGYGICSFVTSGEDVNRNFYDQWTNKLDDIRNTELAKEDAYIKLARNTINEFIENDKIITPPEGLPDDMLSDRKGVFVSLYLNGNLRGCIGTISPVQKNIAEEIISNAIAAAVRDPRFSPLTIRELRDLKISVDELFPFEEINSISQLDEKIYGIIVSKEGKQGLLLPNLDGIDSVEKQIEIARLKANIDPEDNNITIKRFKVIRHK